MSEPLADCTPLGCATPTLVTIPFSRADPGFCVLSAPVALCGDVVSGYGRGSRELGIPTANLDPDALGSALDGVPPGVYCGWASIAGSEPYMAVMSIG